MAPKVGLVLGSGAARGWSHIGIVQRLVEIGIGPDVVCGCSMGALVGAAYVTGHVEQLHARASSLGWSEVVAMLDVDFSAGGLIAGDRVEAFVEDVGIAGDIENLPHRFAAVATDLINGREVWLQSGPVGKAIRASIGMPGVFSPVLHDGRMLLDGGLVNPVPVSLCRALGADIIIAVDLNADLLGRRFTEHKTSASTNHAHVKATEQLIDRLPLALQEQLRPIAERLLQPRPDLPGYFEVLANALNITQDLITRTRLAGEPPHVLLQPRLADMRWMEFHKAAGAIAEGRACVDRALPALERHVNALG